METHADWRKHVSTIHGLSPVDAQNGILILEEANMVLRIPNSPRLDTLVTMIRGSSSSQSSKSANSYDIHWFRTIGTSFSNFDLFITGPARKEQYESPEAHTKKTGGGAEVFEKTAEDLSQKKALMMDEQDSSRDSEDDSVIGIKVERPDTPD